MDRDEALRELNAMLEEATKDGVKGYTIERGGEALCIILKADNSAYYCLDSELSGDNYFHMIALTGESKLVERTACNYYSK